MQRSVSAKKKNYIPSRANCVRQKRRALLIGLQLSNLTAGGLQGGLKPLIV